MRAAIYIRVSTDEQAKEGFSIEAQKRKLISYADAQDWSISISHRRWLFRWI
ncbi:recombinase family protein [Paenibacillus baimaensis]|uniref:recombinase family protein n=1 Tax=Paenibacillus baimaensis TaxID=2982185 RepID=UPI0038CD3CB1